MFASGTPLATRGFHVSRLAQATRRFSAALGACHALHRRTSVEINVMRGGVRRAERGARRSLRGSRRVRKREGCVLLALRLKTRSASRTRDGRVLYDYVSEVMAREAPITINARSIRNLNVRAPIYVRCIQKYLLPVANQTAYLNRTRYEG